MPHALLCDWSQLTLATSAVDEWFDCAWLQKFVNELAPPTLQTLGTSVRRVKGIVAFTFNISQLPYKSNGDWITDVHHGDQKLGKQDQPLTASYYKMGELDQNKCIITYNCTSKGAICNLES